MAELLFIKEYYEYLLVFFGIMIVYSILSYTKTRNLSLFVDLTVLVFAGFTAYYIGMRPENVGTDTSQYQYMYRVYGRASSFHYNKDIFFDYLTYLFAKYATQNLYFIFCASIYVFAAILGLKKIFKSQYYIAFLLFLITPYFTAWGFNVMRSGMAASVFILAMGIYYNGEKRWKVLVLLTMAILLHISMFVPLSLFIVTRYFKNTRLIFILWLFSIFLAVLNVNVLKLLIGPLSTLLDPRIGNYVSADSAEGSWINFAAYGFVPVAFAIYNILGLKYKNTYYTWLANAYMLIHIPFIILISTRFAQRIGYLAEFMMPILLLFPFFVDSKFNIKGKRIILVVGLAIVFLLKAFKILIM